MDILVVDDEVQERALANTVLAQAGYQVHPFPSGKRALQYLDSGVFPDLILIDLVMPVMDGLQLLRRIKRSTGHTKIPVVLLSSIANESIVMQGIKLGASGYIRKPFHPKELLGRVAACLEKNGK